MRSTDRLPSKRLAGLVALLLAGCGSAVPSSPASPSWVVPSYPPPSPTPTPAPTFPATACRGANVDWSDLPAALAAYGSAWNAPDVETGDELLQTALAADATYIEPWTEELVVGARAIAGLNATADGRYLEPRNWESGDLHHGFAQLRLRVCTPGGIDVGAVDDFLELDAGGRINRVARYFTTRADDERPSVCELPAGNWTGIPEIARKWAATTISEPAERATLLREVIAEHGWYVDPSDAAPVVGYDALEERIGGMLWEGAFFEAAAWADDDAHHDTMRLRWRLCDRDRPGLEGVDYVRQGEDGRFTSVVGFFPW